MAFNPNFIDSNRFPPFNPPTMPFGPISFNPVPPVPPLYPAHQYGASFTGNYFGAQPTDTYGRSGILTAALSTSPSIVPPIQPVVIEIPQRTYKAKHWDYAPSPPILFNINGLPGLNMYDAFHNRFAGLEGRDDLVLQGATNAFSCRFLFPGYPNGSFQIFTTRWNKNRDPITRSKLAHEVSKGLQKYLGAIATETMDTSTAPQWEIGQGFMHLECMYLAKLQSVSVGSYQPQLYIMDTML